MSLPCQTRGFVVGISEQVAAVVQLEQLVNDLERLLTVLLDQLAPVIDYTGCSVPTTLCSSASPRKRCTTP